MSGRRDNEGKARMSLLPFDALREVAKLFTWGANKYGAWNWAKGLSYTETMDSLLRHTEQWLNRKDIDESGFHHDVHIAWNALVLLAMRLRGIGKDDRLNSVSDDVPSHSVEGDSSNPVAPVTTSNKPPPPVVSRDDAHMMWPDHYRTNLRHGMTAVMDPETGAVITYISDAQTVP